ncbi:hypothetical protein [Nostoc sp. CALU 1950]
MIKTTKLKMSARFDTLQLDAA